MKSLRRNKRKFYWCAYLGKTAVKDSGGYETGEVTVSYSPVNEMYANISTARGTSDIEMFGNFNDYDKVLIVDNPEYAMDENSVLFVDKTPNEPTGTPPNVVWEPQFDYVVKRVSRSLNHAAYAIARVSR